MSLQTLATLDAAVKRATMSAGKRAAPAAHLSGLSVVPLQPASPDLVLRLQLNTPHQVYVTYAVGHHDIRAGDVLTVGGVDYPIRGAAKWTPPTGTISSYMELVVEELAL